MTLIPYPLGGLYPLGASDRRVERWRAERISPTAPAPVVVVAASSPRDSDVPRSARWTVEAAQRAGWDVRATFALAEAPAWIRVLKTTGERRRVDAKLVASLALRLRAPGGAVRGVALWLAGRFDVAWLVERGVGLRRYGERDLRQRLEGWHGYQNTA